MMIIIILFADPVVSQISPPLSVRDDDDDEFAEEEEFGVSRESPCCFSDMTQGTIVSFRR
jgi:hypothetical protein